MTDVLVLCGGLGTRLQGALPGLPKALAPVGGRPFLQLLLEHARAQGFRRFILCVGHGADLIEERFRGEDGVEFSRESEPLGTAGALRLAAPLLRSPAALVLNGDSFCGADYRPLLELRESRGAPAAVAAAPAQGRRDAGFLRAGEDGQVEAFDEKDASRASPLINAGVYAFDERVFAAIPPAGASSLERDVLPAFVGRGLLALPVPEPVFDIGTPERLEEFRRKRG